MITKVVFVAFVLIVLTPTFHGLDYVPAQNRSTWHHRGRRVEHAEHIDALAPLPLLIIDPMVPGQRLKFSSMDPMLPQLVDRGKVCVLGAGHDGSPYHFGVSASLKSLAGSEWELRGIHHVRLLAASDKPDSQGITWGRCQVVHDQVEPVDMDAARELTALVSSWRGLVEGSQFEKFPGQVQRIIDDLGPIPLPEEAGRRALWVAGLVNPLPALGVAYEIRPAALVAASVRERLAVVTRGIQRSIGHISGTARLF